MADVEIAAMKNGFMVMADGIWREAKGKSAHKGLPTGTGYYKRLVLTVTKDMWDLEIRILHQTALDINSDTKLVKARLLHDGTITYSLDPRRTDWLMKVTATTVGLLKLGFPDLSFKLINLENSPVFQLRRLGVPGLSTWVVKETEAGNGAFGWRKMGFGEVSAAKLAELARLRRGTVKEVVPAARMKSAAKA